MSMDVESRLAALEERVKAMEEHLWPSPFTQAIRAQIGSELINSEQRTNPEPQYREYPEPEFQDNPIGGLSAIDGLLDRLLADPPALVSYSDAYRCLIGPYEVWRNGIHPAQVIQLARQSSWRRVGKLAIQLDALIVGKETRRPGKGHFTSAKYSEVDWIQTFGAWPIATFEN